MKAFGVTFSVNRPCTRVGLLVVVDPVVLVVAAALAAEAEAAEGEGEHEGVEAVEEVRAQPDCAGGQLNGEDFCSSAAAVVYLLTLFARVGEVTLKM